MDNEPLLQLSDLQKFQQALDLLQKSQYQVDEAAQKICSIPGLSDEWTKLCNLHDTIKKRWHELDTAYNKIEGIEES